MSNKQASKGANILNSPEGRRKLRSLIVDIAAQLQFIADRRETIKEMVDEISEQYGIDKKHIRRMATTYHKANYTEAKKTEESFAAFYELIVEGGLRDDEVDVALSDPLDRK